MPLHLLSKKSWNVYSPANIERVKRDEAKARRRATEQEKRSLKQEAGDRLSTLQQQSKNQSRSLKRKLPGEDDTDRDIRLALENSPVSANKEKQDYGSLVDAHGHISLIPAPEKRSCVDQEEAKDPYTVYLTDATGKRDRSKDTWYTSIQLDREKWGEDNPRKQERELARLNANDPLAAMKRGVKALRENERQRQEWMRERERDLEEVEEMGKQRHDRKRRKRAGHNEDDSESLEGFNLDDGHAKLEVTEHHRDGKGENRHGHHHSHHHHHHHRHRRWHRDYEAIEDSQDHHKRHGHHGGDDTNRAKSRETEET
ncbi:uncharacterized protein Z519_05033 [Cladophialophora bantiana CBS 173.52]|uniref:CBF1-interacting co-repressor CIR N-terminal domain-containing protein n=1 Tax=Cladophialophora bantiana (strain ATCC 10958 / CBS 173.52 / CDC B-1940 / NIH 8579) TaxID=1442370 RepID=A0A0D2IA99_CLAB1|nr:uncharacterized protein Z519_05033 [Cladophialophora bantiana CBS 173.52]KIW93719.1 hypothetical protein Z519_05033 [Cladophialophora bantiana CBS 173.52]